MSTVTGFRRPRSGTEEINQETQGSPPSTGVVKHHFKWDALGLAWVVAAGIAPLIPALVHGAALGPYDILSTIGLTSTPGGSVHNFSQRDLIALFIPFTNLVWTQVHHGVLPLWNPFSGLGMPLAFNWESAPLGLPQLIGYLAPIQLAFTVGVLVTVVVGGTGAYVFGRVLRLGPLASALLGTVFVLSGPIFSFLGWSSTSAGSWTGWIFAAAVLVIRGRRRIAWVCGLAVGIAMSIYAGHPETTLLILIGLFVFVVLLLVHKFLSRREWNQVLAPTLALAAAGAAGLALSAPVLLPGLQLINQSGRTGTGNYASISIPNHTLLQFAFQGFDGFPTAGSHWFGSVSYEWTADYVGIIAIVLALVAIGTRWRRPEVQGLTAVIVVMGALALVRDVASFVSHLPVVGSVILSFALVPLALSVAALAGIGLERLVRHHEELRTRQWAGACFGAAALALVLIWVFDRGHLAPSEANIRATSFVWPAVATLIGLSTVLWVDLTVRRSHGRPRIGVGRVAGGILLVCETAFLVASGAPLWTSSPHPLQTTPAVTSLQRKVGTSLVGLGASQCIASTYLGTSQLGILAQANTLFLVHELDIYDPLIPKSYFTSWQELTGSQGGSAYFYQFCPAVTSIAAARRFGVQYVLEERGSKGPAGTSFVGQYGDEELYRVPGSASATLVPAAANAPLPPNDAPGQPVHVHTPNPSTWQLTTSAARAQVLRLRLTNVPGWKATIDGQPLQLQPYSGVMLQARVPPGRHRIVIEYWPTTFTAGLVLAAVAIAGLVSALLWESVRRRRIPGGP